MRSQLTTAGFGASSKSPNTVLSVEKTYAYDNDNRLASCVRNIVVNGVSYLLDSTSYLSDANGNRTQKITTLPGITAKNTTTYLYDLENRLTTLKTNTSTAQFTYGGDGRRSSLSDSVAQTRFLYDGNNVILEKAAATNTTQRGYTRNPEAAGGIGGIIALKNNTVTRTYPALALSPGEQVNEEDLKVAEPQAVKGVSPYYYFYDGQGSVGSFTGSSGADIGAYGYDAFGRDIDHSGIPGGNAYKFSTKEFEPIFGMYYFGGRYYDPDAGRWLTPDPIGMADGLNKYLYVHNDPVNFVDPLGLCGERLDWPQIINAGKIGNGLSSAIFLGFMLNPATAPAGAIGLSLSGGFGLAWGAAESYATGKLDPLGGAILSYTVGLGAGKLGLSLANMTEVNLNAAMRYYSPETGRFVATAVGGTAIGLKNAAESISGTIVDLFTDTK